MPRVALASARGLDPMDQDEGVLAPALAARGVDVAVVPWDEPGADWGAFDLVLVRSTWDYDDQRDAFVAWAERVGTLTTLRNPAEVVRWNTHKGYLLELEERGAPIVPTAWLGAGDRVVLDDLLADRGWTDAVVKPTVGAGARGLSRVRPGDAAGQVALDALLARGDVMVQPFVADVTSAGELSVIVLDGRVSHAVNKVPAPGDIRIQIEHGGTYRVVEPDADTVALAEWIVSSTGQDLLYARVDLLPDGVGGWMLGELEATEPSLYLRWSEAGTGRLADLVVRAAGG
ncbi:MAG: RimK family alpha-L-glutamate ligase [Actinomycetes bacterium]